LLTDCKETDEPKLMREYSCPSFKAAKEAVLDARMDLIEDFGLRALKFELLSVKRNQLKVRHVRRTRRHV
jgi:hypothetical protein